MPTARPVGGWARRNWLITGAASGFGRAAAEIVAARGGRVFATARRVGALDDLSNRYRRQVVPLALDVTDPAQILDVVQEAEERGGIDVLLNNAGYGLLGGVEESLEDEIAAQLDTNFWGALRMIRAVLPAMRRRASGFIVNMSSMVAARGFPGSGYYAASKAALEGLSDSLAQEMSPLGIRVMIVQPGPFRTDFGTRSIRMTRNPLSDYLHLAERRAARAIRAGRESGDPMRAIAAMLTAMNADQPPLRLALGAEARRFVGDVLGGRIEELAAWAGITESTDFVDQRVSS